MANEYWTLSIFIWSAQNLEVCSPKWKRNLWKVHWEVLQFHNFCGKKRKFPLDTLNLNSQQMQFLTLILKTWKLARISIRTLEWICRQTNQFQWCVHQFHTISSKRETFYSNRTNYFDEEDTLTNSNTLMLSRTKSFFGCGSASMRWIKMFEWKCLKCLCLTMRIDGNWKCCVQVLTW